MASTNKAAADAVQATLDGVTSSAETGIPGLVFVSMDKAGHVIQANVSGKQGLTTQHGSAAAPMSLDTVFWIASCTKLLTTIACLQAVEQGKLHLDDPQHLYQYCPEIRDAKIVNADGATTRPRQKDVTLRMLLAHTAGYGYEFFEPRLVAYGRPVGFDAFSCDEADIVRTPMVNEPGSKWQYGINIDWAGIYLERGTGVRLNDWFQEHIMKPLNLDSINMFPTPEMRKNLAHMHQRWRDGKVEERDHIHRRALSAETPEEKARIFQSGGAGCFAKPMQYVEILVTLLNDGTSPKTGASILKPATVAEMWKNQIPEFPDFGRGSPTPPKSEQSNPVPDFYPQEGNPAQGWGLSFFQTIVPGVTGRGANCAWWAGIANCFWWCDREKGVAGMIASQIMPFADPHVMGAWFGGEKAIYDHLGK